MQMKTNLLVRTAMVTALVFVLTRFSLMQIPTLTGANHLFHLGLPFCMLLVFILPWKHAMFAAALGSVLVNIFGSPIWAPATFVLRLLVVYIVYKFVDINKLAGFLIAGVLSATGYYLYEVAVISRNFVASLAGYGMLLIEGVAAAVIAWVILYSVNSKGKMVTP